MQRARDQLLAGARLAKHEHRAVVVHQPPHQRVHPLHGRAVANDVVEVVHRLQLGARAARLLFQRPLPQHPLEDMPDLIHIKRLVQIIGRPQLHRLDRRLGVRNRGGHDDRQPGLDLQRLFQHLQPAQVRHLHVQQHRIERLSRPQRRQPFRPRRGRDHLVPILQNVTQ